MQEVFSFSAKDFTADKKIYELMGIRGKRLMELASLGLPILPGFIVTQANFDHESLCNQCTEAFSKMSQLLGKKLHDKKNPLLVKIVVSPILNVPVTISSIHNIGLCDETLEPFSTFVGEEFAYHEYRNLISQILNLYKETLDEPAVVSSMEKAIKDFKSCKKAAESKKMIEKYRPILPEDIFRDSFKQFQFVLKTFYQYCQKSEVISDSAFLVQAMTFGNYGKESFSGYLHTRDIITGAGNISGRFFENSFDASDKEGTEILKLKDPYQSELKKIGDKLEKNYKEIRYIKFTIEDGKLWIIDQSSEPAKSAQAEIQTYLDLIKSKTIDEKYAIQMIKPARLSEILHPVLDKKGIKGIPVIKGGISGAMGAAIGRVFFSTEKLLNEFRIATQNNTNKDFILVMPSTYAEDVKAIEVARGVLTQEGGYASHAPVVARSLGKVALVNPEIVFQKNAIKIGQHIIKEGDFISIDVPSYSEPSLYIGKLALIEPQIENSGIIEYLDVVQKFIGDFDVHANADQPKDALLAKMFKAKGIGLCRTEHMFFNEKRIPIFRSMILAEDKAERAKILSKLKKMQTDDFYQLFKIMQGEPVTIRLLDAPLHEFLPHTKEAMDEFLRFMCAENPKLTAADIKARCDLLEEVNPMLGHRGVRIAISYPEIYGMQVEAIFEAAYKLRSEGVEVIPEIMIPIVMTEREIKSVRFGKKIEGATIIGIKDIELEIRKKLKADPMEYKVGTMIELPAAAALSDKIARYADFFSFGTNDLTQTTNGLSRDDFNSFFTDYNEFDLLEKNPFQFLGEPVKEMIRISVERGRLTRPDLKIGLCGEHGAEPENIPFCKELGLNYVSCNPYGIPLAKLAIAQLNIQDMKG
jgi:pyruvate,orthophosphate dikinase